MNDPSTRTPRAAARQYGHRIRITTYLPPDVFSALEAFAHVNRRTISQACRQVITRFLRTEDETAIVKELRKHSRRIKTTIDNTSVLLELFHAYLVIYHMHHPPVPGTSDHLRSLRDEAHQRIEKVVDVAARYLYSDNRLAGRVLRAVADIEATESGSLPAPPVSSSVPPSFPL